MAEESTRPDGLTLLQLEAARRGGREAAERILKHRSKSREDIRLARCIVIMIVCIWSAIGLAPSAIWGLDRGGTFGDSFGTANALFSGLAFAGVVYALVLQRRESSDTRIEAQRERDDRVELDLMSIQATAASALARAYWEAHLSQIRGEDVEVVKSDDYQLGQDAALMMAHLRLIVEDCDARLLAIRAGRLSEDKVAPTGFRGPANLHP